MRLLLDEMHDPAVAQALRRSDRDVLAIAELPLLKGLSDAIVLACSTLDGRALVTEDVNDFVTLHAVMMATETPHAGMILTHPRRFPRDRRDALSQLASALSRFLVDVAPRLEGTPFLWWLERADD